MSPSVQQQLRDQAAVLTCLAAASPPADQRAAAFGEMGKLLLAVESFGEAEACLLNASELNPSDSRWTYYLGHVYRSQGDSQKAAAYFERTLKARPDDVAALVWLGNMYLDQGRTVEAGPLFSRALALDATAAAAHAGLGRVSLAGRDYMGAIEHLETALKLNRSASSVHYLLASAYRGAGQADRAMRTCDCGDRCHSGLRIRCCSRSPICCTVQSHMRVVAIGRWRAATSLAR